MFSDGQGGEGLYRFIHIVYEHSIYEHTKDKDLKKRVSIKRTFSIHHWLGLLVGVFLLIASITGSILVFHHEIDHAQFAGLTILEKPAERLMIDNSLTRISQLHPGSDIRMPEFPEDLSQALKFEVRNKSSRKWVFAHPESGETLATVARADQRLVHILLELHYKLLSGTAGTVMVLLCGIALIILTLTGFFLYRKSIFKVISFRQRISIKNRYTFFSSLHRTIGVWSLVFNLLISISGTWIAYTIVQAAFASANAAPEISAKQTVPASRTNASVDASLREIKSEYPDFEMKYLRFANGKCYVFGRLASDPAIYGRTASRVQVDMHTGKIEQASFLQDRPWTDRVLQMMKPLHFGDFAGLAVKILYSFFGIFPGVLAISGFFIWRNRRISKKAKRPEKRVTAKPVARPRPRKIPV